MTYDTKAQAYKAAKSALSKMRGKGWRSVVHENLGWHFRLLSGPVQVYQSSDGKFWAMIGGSPNDSTGGLAAWTPSEYGNFTDPNRAVAYARKFVTKHADNVLAVLKAVEYALTGMR